MCWGYASCGRAVGAKEDLLHKHQLQATITSCELLLTHDACHMPQCIGMPSSNAGRQLCHQHGFGTLDPA
jgi:hypothetical protein